jgi:hypothetical protein
MIYKTCDLLYKSADRAFPVIRHISDQERIEEICDIARLDGQASGALKILHGLARGREIEVTALGDEQLKFLLGRAFADALASAPLYTSTAAEGMLRFVRDDCYRADIVRIYNTAIRPGIARTDQAYVLAEIRASLNRSSS